MAAGRKARIAINGFGRIGRLFFRQAFGKFAMVAVNDLSDPATLAYLLRYDSVYRQFDKKVKVGQSGVYHCLVVAGRKTIVLQEKDPIVLPWSRLGIDVVVEATGVFNRFADAEAHLRAGARKVVITAPVKDEERPDARTILLGVNEDQFKGCRITANGSCTTNAAHPIAAIMMETVGVKKAMINTVHGYTASQNLVDGVTKTKDVRRGRAAGVNIVPSTTGATSAVARALPELAGKFDGLALRVPVVTGSVVDFTFVAGRPTNTQEINNIFRRAAKQRRWRGILAVTDEPIVSSDIIGRPYGSIIDLTYTKVVAGDLVKILSWYDNEWGYVATLTKHVEQAARTL